MHETKKKQLKDYIIECRYYYNKKLKLRKVDDDAL